MVKLNGYFKMDELNTIEEVSADEISIGEGMDQMYDLWSDDTAYCMVSTEAQTDMEAEKKPEQETKETQMETETKEAEVQTSETQLSVSKVFNLDESAMTAYGHITRRVEENMCWGAKLGDFMEIGVWRKPYAGYRLVAYEFSLGRFVTLEKHEQEEEGDQWIRICGKFSVKNEFRGGGYMHLMEMTTAGKPKLRFAMVTMVEYKLNDMFKAQWGRRTPDRYLELELTERQTERKSRQGTRHTMAYKY